MREEGGTKFNLLANAYHEGEADAGCFKVTRQISIRMVASKSRLLVFFVLGPHLRSHPIRVRVRVRELRVSFILCLICRTHPLWQVHVLNKSTETWCEPASYDNCNANDALLFVYCLVLIVYFLLWKVRCGGSTCPRNSSSARRPLGHLSSGCFSPDPDHDPEGAFTWCVTDLRSAAGFS